MKPKKKLEIDSLVVDSFETAAPSLGRGTVRGRAEDCTCVDTCLCRTAAYVCATVRATVFSCDYTINPDSCVADSEACWSNGCGESYPVCYVTEGCVETDLCGETSAC